MVKRADLEQLVIVLNNRTGRKYGLDHMTGGYRLLRREDDRFVSGRLTAGAMKTYLDGFIDGIEEQIRNTPNLPVARCGPAMG